MPVTFVLSRTDAEILRKIAVAACTRDEFEHAWARCPGAPDWDEVELDETPKGDLADYLLRKVATVSPYLPSSFLLRLIEQKWDVEKVRRAVVMDMPALVRAPRGVDVQVGILRAALEAMRGKLPEALTPGTIDDPRFGRVCERREAVARMVDSLGRFEAMKAAHDSLHMLQVLGAEWLDTLGEQSGGAPSTEPLAGQLLRVADEMTAGAAKLPDDLAGLCNRCRDTCNDAAKRIGTGNRDELAFACANLRAMLKREPPEIDHAMFVASRDFPLREFHALFDDSESGAREAAFDLGDTLRRRLMEHALWQAIDLSLYLIEEALAHPTARLTADLTDLFPWTRSTLNRLFDAATAQRVIPPMNDAVQRYVLSSGGRPPAGLAPAAVKDVCAAFADLRDAARSAFLEVDQALKRDFTQLLPLQDLLRAVLERVPSECRLFLP